MAEEAKKIDESWKESVVEEKGRISEESSREFPEASYPFFISSLGMQAMGALNEKSADLPQARYFIDLIDMLAQKTQGNLSPEEETVTQNLLYELRVKYVEKTKTPGSS